MEIEELVRLIDHTILSPSAVRSDILTLCDDARLHGFCAVCIAPTWVSTAASALDGSCVKVATVVGFPHGNTLPEVKAGATQRVTALGADEVDMVMNIGAMRDRDLSLVREDIAGVVCAARGAEAAVKVIIEACLLNDEEKVMACQIAKEAGADFVKTSTGYAEGGATAHDVRLMRETVGDGMGVKAAGGIRTLATALEMVNAGASRLGCSSSIKIIEEAAKT